MGTTHKIKILNSKNDVLVNREQSGGPGRARNLNMR